MTHPNLPNQNPEAPLEIQVLNGSSTGPAPEPSFKLIDDGITRLIQGHLIGELESAAPDSGEVKTWFMLLVEAQKIELLREKNTRPAHRELLTEEEKMARVWDVLCLPDEERARRLVVWRERMKSSQAPAPGKGGQ